MIKYLVNNDFFKSKLSFNICQKGKESFTNLPLPFLFACVYIEIFVAHCVTKVLIWLLVSWICVLFLSCCY